MQYPTLLEYMKAIQNAGVNLDKLAHLSVVLDGQGEPCHISGDSSVVFKMQDKTTGKCYALKCFTKAQKGCADASSNSSSVKFLEKELLVLSQGKEEKYPVLLMDWVDGDSLGACQLKVEDMSTVATKAELNEAITDEFGVKYSKDGRKLLKAPYELDSTYSIKEGVKIICERAFFCCGSLSSLVIPESVSRIGNGAFNGCYYLQKLEIPDGVTRLGEGAFEGCSSLGSLVIPDSVTSIEDRVFNDCHSLKSLVIPDGVTSIGEDAFAGCESLKSLVIPASVVNIKGDPFYCWTGKLRCLSPYYIYEDNVLFDRDKSTIISFRDIKATSYTIPDSVTSIGERAFSGCESLKNLVIPDSVTSIGDSAFEGCTSLKNLVIPDNITSIEKGVFQGCSSLTDIVIPNRVTSIGEGAFFACNSLTSIVIPSSVICIGTWAFYGCESLKSLVIPDSVTSIGDETFYGCCFPNDLKQELISRFGNRIFVKP